MSWLLRSQLLGTTPFAGMIMRAPDDGAGAAAAAAAAPAAGAPAAGAAAAAAAPAAGAAAAEPAKGAGTIAAGADAPAITAAAKWPDNWRDELAGGDQAKLNILKRYDSPAAFAASGFELRGKMDRGELKAPAAPLPANATDEQKAAWREAQGLPKDAAGYLGALKLSDGLVIGETDKPLVEGFVKDVALEAGLSPDAANKAVDWYFKQQEAAKQQQVAADGQFKQAALVELGQEWGKDFTANNNAVTGLINMMPEAIRDRLLTARTPDGRMLGDDPNFNRAMLMLAKEINPAAAVLPATAGGGLTGVETRIAEIETKYMKAQQGTPEWNQYWKSAAMQNEYRELLGARETMKDRAKSAA